MILVIFEDSDDDFDTVCEAVKQSGVAVEVQRATTGGGGLVLLGKLAAARSVPVLMNLNTPGTDGFEALAAIKANPTLKAIPVVAFSTSANPRDVGSVYAAGVNAHHVKPVRYPDHLQLVIDLVGYWFGRVVLPSVGGNNP